MADDQLRWLLEILDPPGGLRMLAFDIALLALLFGVASSTGTRGPPAGPRRIAEGWLEGVATSVDIEDGDVEPRA